MVETYAPKIHLQLQNSEFAFPNNEFVDFFGKV